MAKSKTSFFCQSCGAQSAKWLGKCPACGAWNSYAEEVILKEDKSTVVYTPPGGRKAVKAKPITDVISSGPARITLPDAELNRVLGGGLVPGMVALVGGEPGIGKSTLMLQTALSMPHLKLLYVTGEESEEQIRMRADRLGQVHPNCYILPETDTQNIFKQIEAVEPHLVIVDSIQTMQSAFLESAAGSVGQVRECTAEFIRFAKESNTPVFLIGHITKDGAIAGPKVLEHMVDTVLQFEGDRHHLYRLLRSIKNRFGSTSELGIYEMNATGLRGVENPTEILLTDGEEDRCGVAVAAVSEGNRVLPVEVQSLVSPSAYGTPQRSANGYEQKRLNMMLAVLEKKAGFRLGNQDVFLNLAGGMRTEDPAADMAVCAALISSYQDISLPKGACFSAEVGLGGELRSVPRIEARIAEAEKLGFTEMYISKHNLKSLTAAERKIKLIAVGKIEELMAELFG